MTRDRQLADLESAYQSFVYTIKALSSQAFLALVGDWTPRDILAHLIGWNLNIGTGCREILEGRLPFYHYDSPNDYREINAEFIARYDSTDREALLAELEASKNALVSYLKGVNEELWALDTGVKHYRGGPATVARCVDSLIRDYRNHQEEIAQGTEISPGGRFK